MILQNFINKCKERKEVLFSILLITVALISFSLGRLSAFDSLKGDYPYIEKIENGRGNIEKPLSAIGGKVNTATSVLGGGGLLVASKNGTKYHFPWCAGARTISEANKIWFNSEEEAKNAGYAPASNCKGLK